MWALSAAMMGALAGGCAGRAAARSSTVDQDATPPGWVAVDYGRAQVSVPADWVVGACPTSAQGTVILGTVLVNCPAYGSNRPAVRVTPLGGPPATGQSIRVHGIQAYLVPYRGPGHVATDQVPSLGVSVEANGPLSSRILATLTRSPRDVVLAAGPPPSVPGTWRRVTFAGVSVAVPRTWPVDRSPGEDTCEPWSALSPSVAHRVVLYRGTSILVPCLFTKVAPVRALAPADGLVIDPGATGPFSPAPSGTPCSKVNALSVCRATSQPLDVLIVGVLVPGQRTPVVLELGLSGSGQTARTILWSLSATSTRGST